MNVAVVTGGTGSGKTPVVNEMERCGMYTAREVAAEAIEVLAGLVGLTGDRQWRTDHRSAYQALIFSVQRQFEGAISSGHDGWVITDRALLDGLAYCIEDRAPVSWQLVEAAIEHRPIYEVVFVLGTPRESVFRGRSPRKRSVNIGQGCEAVYRAFGYPVSRTRFDSVDRRCDMILDHLGLQPAFGNPAP